MHKSQPVPKVFEKVGYRFFFYNNEHAPVHVHVRYGSGEAVFHIGSEVQLSESYGLKVNCPTGRWSVSTT